MINTTERPILRIEGVVLDRTVCEVLYWVEEVIREEQKSTNEPTYRKKAFANFLGKGNRRPGCRYDEKFIQAAFDFANSDALHCLAKTAMLTMVTYVIKGNVSRTSFSPLKRGLKLVLVELWRRGALLLPTVFTPGAHFPMGVVENEIIQWLRTMDPLLNDGVRLSKNHRLYFYGPRLVFATEWLRVEDVSISDISELHLAQQKYRQGLHPNAVAGAYFPWSQLPSELLNSFPERVSFSKDELIRYSAWSARNCSNRGELEAF